MGFYILENGRALLDFDMDEDCRCGKMEVNMKAIGLKVKLMVEEGLCLLMEIYMKAISLTTRWKGKENIFDLTGQSIEENGKLQFKKVLVLKSGLMEPNSQGNTQKDLKLGKECFDGVRKCNTKGNFLITTFMDLEFSNGMMEEYTRVIGSKTS